MSGAVLALLILSLSTVPEEVAPGTTIVVDSEGTPVAEARVEVISKPASESVLAVASTPNWTARTSADGRVDLDLPAGRPLLVSIDHPGSAPLLASMKAPLPPVLHLDPGEVLRGRVTGAVQQKQGFQGTACAEWQSRAAAWQRKFSRRRCGELSRKGRFEIRGLPAETVDLVAAAEGFLARRVELRPGEPATVKLERGILVRGRIRAAHGEAVAGATVREEGEPGVQTGRSGRFELPVRTLPTTLRIRREGFSPASRRLGRRVDPAEEDLVIVLQAAQRLTGSVLGAGGESLEEVQITLRRRVDAGRVERARHTVDLDQRSFDLSIEHPGRYGVSLRAEGHGEVTLPPVRLTRGERRDLGLIELSAGALVHGTLRDGRSGEAVAAAQVALVPRGEKVFQHLLEGRRLDAVSGEEGAFSIGGAEAGDYELAVESPDHAPLRREVHLEEDEALDLGRLYLEPGTRVHGKVVDRRGAPQSGVTVQLFDRGRATLLPVAETVTAADGTFPDVSVAAGGYRVEVSRERLLLSQAVEIPDLDEYEVELVAGGVELHGTVSRSGEPVSSGILELASQHDPALNGTGRVVVQRGGGLTGGPTVFGAAETSVSGEVRGDGTFSISNAPTGDVLATYYDPAGPPVRRRISVPDQPSAWIDVDLGGVALEGRIVDGATRTGVAASVEVLAPGGGAAGGAAASTDGLFRVSDLVPGVYAVRVKAEGYRTELLDSVEVRRDRQPLRVSLRPAQTGSLHISLRRPDGSPLAGVFVSLVDEAGSTVRSLLSDAQGERRYGDLSPGRYHVVWSDPGAGVGASPPLEVRAGEPSRWEKTVPSASALTLACEPAVCAGRPLDHLLLFSTETGVELARFLRGVAANARFTQQGRLPVGSLSPGSYVLHAGVGGVAMEGRFDVSAASSRLVHLEPSAGSRRGTAGVEAKSSRQEAASDRR